VFDPNLVFLVVDNPVRRRRSLSHARRRCAISRTTEQRIIRKMLDVAFEEMKKAWETNLSDPTSS